MIIKKNELGQFLMDILDESVADLPADQREAAKVDILNAFAGVMFQGPTK